MHETLYVGYPKLVTLILFAAEGGYFGLVAKLHF
jgi:hypothetical protein